MSWYKQEYNGYITAIGTTDGAGNCTEDEYNSIMAMIRSRPTAPEGYSNRLTTALAWEQYELPSEAAAWTQDTLQAMTNAELEQVLYGYGISASMNKANMIRMILLAQGGTVI